jgi:hypothetical protein
VQAFGDFWHDGTVNVLLFVLRAIDSRTGVSPLIFVNTATLCAILCPIRRLHLLIDRDPDCPYLNFDTDHIKSFKGVRDLENQIDCLLRKRLAELRYAAGFENAGFIVFVWLAYLHSGRSIEGSCFDVLLLLGAFYRLHRIVKSVAPVRTDMECDSQPASATILASHTSGISKIC